MRPYIIVAHCIVSNLREAGKKENVEIIEGENEKKEKM